MTNSLVTYLKNMKGIFIPFVSFSILVSFSNDVFAVKSPEKLTLEMITEANSTSMGSAHKNYKKDLDSLLNRREEMSSDKVLKDNSFSVVESRHKKLKASADRDLVRLNKFMKSYRAELNKEEAQEKLSVIDYGKSGSEFYDFKCEFLFEDGFEKEEVSLKNKLKLFKIQSLLEKYDDLVLEIKAFYYEDEDQDDKIINKAEAWDRGVVVKSFISKLDDDFNSRLKPVVYSVLDDVDDAEEMINFVIMKR